MALRSDRLSTVCRQAARAVFIGLVLLGHPAASVAGADGMGVGDRIRLRTLQLKSHFYGERVHESEWITGTVVLLDARFIRLELAERSGTVSVRRDSIMSLEKSLGIGSRKGVGKFVGMVVGAVAGVAVGVLVAYSPELSREGACEPSSIGDPGCAGTAVLLGTAGFVVGGWGGRKLGGAIGDRIEHEEWEPVGWWEGRLSLGPSGSGSGMGASVVFRF
jgi:hypothetical protein